MYLSAAARQAVIRHCFPGLYSLGREIRHDLYEETHFETGELKSSAYSELDDATGNIQVGYDETNSPKPHGYFYTFGTSEFKGDPVLMRVAFRRRKDRKGNGLND